LKLSGNIILCNAREKKSWNFFISDFATIPPGDMYRFFSFQKRALLFLSFFQLLRPIELGRVCYARNIIRAIDSYD
jgi:hypothetical protein